LPALETFSSFSIHVQKPVSDRVENYRKDFSWFGFVVLFLLRRAPFWGSPSHRSLQPQNFLRLRLARRASLLFLELVLFPESESARGSRPPLLMLEVPCYMKVSPLLLRLPEPPLRTPSNQETALLFACFYWEPSGTPPHLPFPPSFANRSIGYCPPRMS